MSATTGICRKLSGLPTIIVGNIGLTTGELSGSGPKSLTNLEALLNRDEFDLAAIGRPLITEPAWAHKVERRQFEQTADFYEAATKEIFP